MQGINRVFLLGTLGKNGPSGVDAVVVTKRAGRMGEEFVEVDERHRVDPTGLSDEARRLLEVLPVGQAVAIEGRLRDGRVVAERLHVLPPSRAGA